MTPSEYLDATKARIGVTSDYELAKRIEISDKVIPAIRRGERHLPLDVAYRIAITLELDPAEVVADLEGQREKNEKRAAFWRSFTLRARQAAVIALCTLALSYSGISGDAAKLLGGLAVAASAAYLLRLRGAHNLYYVN